MGLMIASALIVYQHCMRVCVCVCVFVYVCVCEHEWCWDYGCDVPCVKD